MQLTDLAAFWSALDVQNSATQCRFCIQITMNLKSMQQRKSAQPGTMVTLDDAEMALELIELQNVTAVTYVAPEQSYDLLCELQSAASLIMDKAECEALIRELDAMQRPHPVAA